MPSTATSRLQGLSTSVAVKAPCKAAATSAITLSGEQTVNGTACVSGDRVLRAPSTAHVDGGIWVVSTGAWTRAKDFDGSRDVVKGTLILVAPGTSDAEVYVVTTSGSISPGTTAIAITPLSGEAITLLSDLANTSNAAKGDALIGVKRTLTSAVATTLHTWIEGQIVNVKTDFGAVGNGVTDDTSAIQAAINAITTGVVFFPAGRYKITSTLSINKGGVTLRGAAPAGQGAVTGSAISEIVASGSMTVAIRFGDPAEATAAGAHLYPGGALENLSVTGTTSTTSGVRIYNITLRVRDCYISNVVAAGGIGMWLKNAWLSIIEDTIVQSNTSYDLWLDIASNSIQVSDCAFLSTSTSDGIHIVGGSNSITLLNDDFEGKANGISIDTASSSLENIAVQGCNFESNTTFGITATGAQPVIGFAIQNYRGSGAGNGINLNNHNALRLDQVFLHNCNLAFGQVGQVADIGRLYLTGTAAITGQSSSIRHRKITESLYEDNTTVGALAYTLDASLYNVLELNLTAACTSITFTFDNTSKRGVGEELLLMVGNTSTATVGGAITLPAAFKKSAALVIPSASTRSFWRFVKDANDAWWETSRSVNVS